MYVSIMSTDWQQILSKFVNTLTSIMSAFSLFADRTCIIRQQIGRQGLHTRINCYKFCSISAA